MLLASRELECSPRHIYNIIHSDEDGTARFQKMREDARRARLDMAEDVVESHIKGMSLKAATFELRQRGKDRGYGNRVEVGGVAGQPVEVQMEALHKMTAPELVELYRSMTGGGKT